MVISGQIRDASSDQMVIGVGVFTLFGNRAPEDQKSAAIKP
jgi:hypothetical protein